MTEDRLQPLKDGRVGGGVSTGSVGDEGACNFAKHMLDQGTTAEGWDGTRLVARAGSPLPAVRNALLRGLPDDEIQHILMIASPVSLVLKQVLYGVGTPIEEVYFLESGLVSLVGDTGDGGMVEVGMTGREGMAGLSVLLNPGATVIQRGIVQIPGAAFRIRTSAFLDAIAQLPTLRARCFRFVQQSMEQTSQTAACNARHELPQRLARWLLMAQDRSDSEELPMTQEFLSYLLGVRRAGVSVVASELQAKGLIRQARGSLTILDRAGLEAQACSCYQLIEDSRRAMTEQEIVAADHGPAGVKAVRSGFGSPR